MTMLQKILHWYFTKNALPYWGIVFLDSLIIFASGCFVAVLTDGAVAIVLHWGALCISMVANLGLIKEGKWGELTEEIRQVKAHCCGKILKVIIETCLLSEEEKIQMCKVVTEAGADYIKTSTGFSTGGATFEDIALFAKHVGKNVKIKAAGGIATLQDAEEFIRLGADRLGTSRIVKLAKAQTPTEGY